MFFNIIIEKNNNVILFPRLESGIESIEKPKD